MASRTKWTKSCEKDADVKGTGTDALTRDLKTTDNTLSLWRIPDNSENNIEEVILALASKRDKVDKIEVAIIKEDEIKKYCELKYDQCSDSADSPYTNFHNNHYDIFDLNYTKIGSFVQVMLDITHEDDSWKKFNIKQVKKILEEGYNKLEKDRLSDKLHDEIKPIDAS